MPRGVKNVQTPVTQTPADGLLDVPSTQDVPLAQTELPTTEAGEENQPTVGTTDDPASTVPSTQVAELHDKFLAWGKSDQDEDLTPYVALGLLNEDHSLTDEGAQFLDENGVAVRVINFLTLGTPVTFDVDGNKHTVNAGSMLRVKHNGRNRDNEQFSVCDVGEFLPEAVIFKNHLHVYTQARYPATQPLTTTYETAP